jgi:hypothetical protein
MWTTGPAHRPWATSSSGRAVTPPRARRRGGRTTTRATVGVRGRLRRRRDRADRLLAPPGSTAERWRREADASDPDFTVTARALRATTHPISSPTWRDEDGDLTEAEREQEGMLQPNGTVFDAWKPTRAATTAFEGWVGPPADTPLFRLQGRPRPQSGASSTPSTARRSRRHSPSGWRRWRRITSGSAACSTTTRWTTTRHGRGSCCREGRGTDRARGSRPSRIGGNGGPPTPRYSDGRRHSTRQHFAPEPTFKTPFSE